MIVFIGLLEYSYIKLNWKLMICENFLCDSNKWVRFLDSAHQLYIKLLDSSNNSKISIHRLT